MTDIHSKSQSLVERLRAALEAKSFTVTGDGPEILREAADEIERLTRERDEYARCLDGGVDCAQEKLRLRAALLFLGKAFELEDDQTDSGFTYREALGHSAGEQP